MPKHPNPEERSIPACTGEPALHCEGSFLREVYPRVYGGTPFYKSLGANTSGLSPRVRGNRMNYVIQRGDVGSIPACTGEPLGPWWQDELREVYPRVYGGTLAVPSPHAEEIGLSPRVRGNQEFGALHNDRDGSIPACTGEPRLRRPCPCWRRVYPRVYGGTTTFDLATKPSPGLSPRVRGNLG